MLTIPSALACFQLERLCPEKVLETSRYICVRSSIQPQLFSAFSKSVWPILSAAFKNESKKQPGTRAIIINVQWLAFKAFLLAIFCHLHWITFGCLNVKLCLLIKPVETKWVNVTSILLQARRKWNHKHHYLGCTPVCYKTFWNLLLPKTHEPVFCVGDLGMVDYAGDLLSQRKSSFLLVWRYRVWFGLPAVWGSESTKLMSNQGGGWKHEKHLHDL